jgi:hypothetical protein
MEKDWNEIVELFETMKDDAAKFYDKQNKAAGKRVRKNAMAVKKLLHEFRKDISEEINSL